MFDDGWKGEHLIRAQRQALPAVTPPRRVVPADRVMAVRNAALAGMSRVEAAEVLNLPYNSVVWICQKHDINFPDARRTRRIEGGV